MWEDMVGGFQWWERAQGWKDGTYIEHGGRLGVSG